MPKSCTQSTKVMYAVRQSHVKRPKNNQLKPQINQTDIPAHMPSTFSFLHKPSAKLKSVPKQKMKKSLSSSLVAQKKKPQRTTKDRHLATYNNTLAKWRGSALICKFRFHL